MTAKTEFRKGDKVRVITGSYQGNKGTIEKVDSHAYVYVRLNIDSATRFFRIWFSSYDIEKVLS